MSGVRIKYKIREARFIWPLIERKWMTSKRWSSMFAGSCWTVDRGSGRLPHCTLTQNNGGKCIKVRYGRITTAPPLQETHRIRTNWSRQWRQFPFAFPFAPFSLLRACQFIKRRTKTVRAIEITSTGNNLRHSYDSEPLDADKRNKKKLEWETFF